MAWRNGGAVGSGGFESGCMAAAAANINQLNL
jgi:hypothetical protein